MALENQPFFKAPSIPKLNKKIISSSVFSSFSSKVKPEIKTSKFSFVNPLQQNLVSPEVLKQNPLEEKRTQENKLLLSSLVETNRILVEIQKQLSLDFSSRIVEKKRDIGASKASIIRKRISQKEKSIESVNQDFSLLRSAFDKVTAPAKTIFDKIIEFISTIATGILVNSAFKWLSDPTNRKKLGQFFQFIADHWRWIVRVLVGIKLLKILGKVVSAVRTIKKISDWLRRNPPKPPSGGPGPRGGSPGPKGGTSPSGGDPCSGFRKCLDNMSAADVENLAKRIIATKTFSPLLGAPSPIFRPAAKPTTAPPVLPVFPTPGLTPSSPVSPLTLPTQAPTLPTTPTRGKTFGEYFSDTQKSLRESTSFLDPLANLIDSPTFQTATMLSPAGFGSRALGLLGFLPKFSRVTQGVRGGTLAEKLSRGVSKIEYGQRAASPIQKRMSPLFESVYNRLKLLSDDELKKLLSNRDSDIRNAALRIIQERGGGVPKGIQEQIKSGTFSQGGTVGGRGSGTVDSVPAMLAPGEEVIRTSAANLFRPLLKDINDNAGRMWQSFEAAIKNQEDNNTRQAETNNKFYTLLTYFNKQIEALIKKEKKGDKSPDKEVFKPTVGNIPPSEGTGRGGPSDIKKDNPSVPTTTVARASTEDKQYPSSPTKGQSTASQKTASSTPSQTVASTPPPSAPAVTGTTQTVASAENVQTTQTVASVENTQTSPTVAAAPPPNITPIKPSSEKLEYSTSKLVQTQSKTYSASSLRKPDKKTNFTTLSIPPINFANNKPSSSNGRTIRGVATEPPTASSTDPNNYYLSSAASNYGILV